MNNWVRLAVGMCPNLSRSDDCNYSKDAFYRVKVTGDNVLKVNRGITKKKDDNTLGY